MDKNIINKIYNDMIGIILKNIDSKYYDEISKNYYSYLCRNLPLYTNPNAFAKSEVDFWDSKTKEDKLRLLLSDEAFDEISKISKEAFNWAFRAYSDGTLISEDEAKKYVKILSDELDNVHEDNKENAKTLVSEGILDLDYACGKQEITSFRLRDVMIANKKQ